MPETEHNLELSRGLLGQAIRNLPLDQTVKTELNQAMDAVLSRHKETRSTQDVPASVEPSAQANLEDGATSQAELDSRFNREREQMERELVGIHEQARLSGMSLNSVLKERYGDKVKRVGMPYFLIQGPIYEKLPGPEKWKLGGKQATSFLLPECSPLHSSGGGFKGFFNGVNTESIPLQNVKVIKPALLWRITLDQIPDDIALFACSSAEPGIVLKDVIDQPDYYGRFKPTPEPTDDQKRVWLEGLNRLRRTVGQPKLTELPPGYKG